MSVVPERLDGDSEPLGGPRCIDSSILRCHQGLEHSLAVFLSTSRTQGTALATWEPPSLPEPTSGGLGGHVRPVLAAREGAGVRPWSTFGPGLYFQPHPNSEGITPGGLHAPQGSITPGFLPLH